MTDWEKIQRYVTAVIVATAVIGFGVMAAMWIGL